MTKEKELNSLSKEELLESFKKLVRNCAQANDCHDCKDAPKCGQAYKQICKLIEDKGDINEVRKFFSALVDIKSEEINRLRELNKPKVSKEFVEKQTDELYEWIERFGFGTDIDVVLKRILQEAGVEVEE